LACSGEYAIMQWRSGAVKILCDQATYPSNYMPAKLAAGQHESRDQGQMFGNLHPRIRINPNHALMVYYLFSFIAEQSV